MATSRPPTVGTLVPDLAPRPKIDWELHTPLNVDMTSFFWLVSVVWAHQLHFCPHHRPPNQCTRRGAAI